MSDVKSFLADPSVENLDQCSKEQLILIAEHYCVDIKDDKRIKENELLLSLSWSLTA